MKNNLAKNILFVLFSMFSAVSLAFSPTIFAPASTYATNSGIFPGDLNGDGAVNVLDLILLKLILLGEIEPVKAPFLDENSDVDQNGIVNLIDNGALLDLIFGVIHSGGGGGGGGGNPIPIVTPTPTPTTAPVTWYQDADGDGYGDPNSPMPSGISIQSGAQTLGYVLDNTDCDDSDALEHPGQTWYLDADGDKYSNGTTNTVSCTRPANYFAASELTATSGDCNDANAAVHPGATEVCNGIDDDCDGDTDEGVTTTYYHDADGDTYTNNSDTQSACADPDGSGTAWVSSLTVNDCDDSDALEYPGQTWYLDADGDKYSNGTTNTVSCTRPADYFAASELTATSGDCDDSDALEHPGQTWYLDADDDGYSNGTTNTVSCTRPANYYVASELTATSGDCDDSDPTVHPGATEVCNGIDDDCDGDTDEGVTTTYYHDADGDTYTNNSDTQSACADPDGSGTAWVSSLTANDCDDADALEYPGQTWYLDVDDDGYSNGTTNTVSCTRPANYFAASELTATSGDCDDFNAAVHPGATEIVNGIDDNCDGKVDIIDDSLHHLGDGAYTGSVNSQFNMSAEGTTYSKSFTADMLQLYNTAKLAITHRGVQKADPIRINGQLISSGWNSPSDGSLGTSTISFDINILKAGANNISITASYDSGSHDYDDFEFTNIYVTLSP